MPVPLLVSVLGSGGREGDVNLGGLLRCRECGREQESRSVRVVGNTDNAQVSPQLSNHAQADSSCCGIK